MSRLKTDTSHLQCSTRLHAGSTAPHFIYRNDVTWIFDSHQVNHHLYADDKQAYVSVPVNNVSLACQILDRCISDITSWCALRRLQLNATKTQLMWFGSCQMLEKLTDSDLTLDTGTTTVIRPVKSVHDLDSELIMKTHISKEVSSCYMHQLHRIHIYYFAVERHAKYCDESG